MPPLYLHHNRQRARGKLAHQPTRYFSDMANTSDNYFAGSRTLARPSSIPLPKTDAELVNSRLSKNNPSFDIAGHICRRSDGGSQAHCS